MNTVTRLRDLSIRNMVFKTVIDTIQEQNMLSDVGHVVLGLSGGPDSMCLLNILLELSKEKGFGITPVHINHLIRPGACHEDQRFCEEYAAAKGLTCKSFVFDCEALAKEQGITTEEAGRHFRYDSFGSVVDEIRKENRPGDVVVAVAQNADDQVETVLMRIMRGTGIDGLRGIPYVREDARGFRVIRPLLDVSKADILDYLKENNIDYCIDKTNNEDIYQRNKIRLNLIPYLEESFNPKAKDAIRRLARSASEDVVYLEKTALEALGELLNQSASSKGRIVLKNEGLKKLNPAIARRVLSISFKQAGLLEDVGSDHYKNAMALIRSESPSGETHLPRNFIIRRQYEDLYIERNSEETCDEFRVIAGPEVLDYGEFRDKTEPELKSKGEKYAAFDLGALKDEFGLDALSRIAIRKRLPGDVISLKMGTKKLQDLMVDDKIPKGQRDDVIVVAIGNQVLWLLPTEAGKMRWSSKWAIAEGCREVVLIRLNH